MAARLHHTMTRDESVTVVKNDRSGVVGTINNAAALQPVRDSMALVSYPDGDARFARFELLAESIFYSEA